MSNQIYQMSQLTCNMCGQPGVSPREEYSYDHFTKENIVEAVWVCPRCNNAFSRGEISRTKSNEE